MSYMYIVRTVIVALRQGPGRSLLETVDAVRYQLVDVVGIHRFKLNQSSLGQKYDYDVTTD